LAGYYQRFIEGVLKISKPMTEFLKKDKQFKFLGIEEATNSRSDISDAGYGEVVLHLL
jgi:hypothetical protein